MRNLVMKVSLALILGGLGAGIGSVVAFAFVTLPLTYSVPLCSVILGLVGLFITECF